MDRDLDEPEFRRLLREWIAADAPAGLPAVRNWDLYADGASQLWRRELADMETSEFLEWEQRLVEANLICPQWPEEYGGRGWSLHQLSIMAQECHRANVPRVHRDMGEFMIGPAILQHGTPWQRTRFLTGIVSGRDNYCQAFSEPDNGSDLGGVMTRGTLARDSIHLTGRKIWCSGASDANLMVLLCRTGTLEERHRGLTLVLVPLPIAGLEIRPIYELSGVSHFCEIFLDDVEVPSENIIGALGTGWSVAMSILAGERAKALTSQRHHGYRAELADLAQQLSDEGLFAQPDVRSSLARALIEVEVLRAHSERLVRAAARNVEVPGGPSVSKLLWTEYHAWFGDMAVDLFGRRALVRPEGEGYLTDQWQDCFLASKAALIYAGTSEIQRNIVAERVLGLPRSRS